MIKKYGTKPPTILSKKVANKFHSFSLSNFLDVTISFENIENLLDFKFIKLN